MPQTQVHQVNVYSISRKVLYKNLRKALIIVGIPSYVYALKQRKFSDRQILEQSHKPYLDRNIPLAPGV